MDKLEEQFEDARERLTQAQLDMLKEANRRAPFLSMPVLFKKYKDFSYSKSVFQDHVNVVVLRKESEEADGWITTQKEQPRNRKEKHRETRDTRENKDPREKDDRRDDKYNDDKYQDDRRGKHRGHDDFDRYVEKNRYIEKDSRYREKGDKAGYREKKEGGYREVARQPKETKDTRETRQTKDTRDTREARETRETKDVAKETPKDNFTKDSKETQFQRKQVAKEVIQAKQPAKQPAKQTPVHKEAVHKDSPKEVAAKQSTPIKPESFQVRQPSKQKGQSARLAELYEEGVRLAQKSKGRVLLQVTITPEGQIEHPIQAVLEQRQYRAL